MGKIEENPPGYNTGHRKCLGTREAEIHAATASFLLLPMSWMKVQLKSLCICYHQTSKFRLETRLRSSAHLLYQKKVER